MNSRRESLQGSLLVSELLTDIYVSFNKVSCLTTELTHNVVFTL